MNGRRTLSARLVVLALWVSAAFFAVGLRVAWLAWVEGQTWERLSLANQHKFQDLPFARGALRDRQGRLIVADRPGYAVRFSYLPFRRGNAAALAVHGVRLAFEAGYHLDPAVVPESWSLADPPERLADAARILASLPLPWTRQAPSAEAWPAFAALQESLARFLALVGRRPQLEVARALATRAREDDAGTCAAAVGLDVAACQAAVLQALSDLDLVAEILEWDAAARGPLRGFLAARDTLLSHRSRSAADRKRRESSALQLVADVPFERVAPLLLERERFAGFDVVHTVARVPAPAPELGFPLAELFIGTVNPGTGHRPPGSDADEDDEADLEETLRDALNLSEEEWRALSTTVKSRLWIAEERRARHGVRGIERDLDSVLQGRLGVRHVLKDKQGRELQEVGARPAESGRDVTLTLDLELQLLAEQALDEEPLVSSAGLGGKPLDAALLVMDCHQGDLLAVAHRQRMVLDAAGTPRLLEINTAGAWRDGTGRAGSVLKALFAAEALEQDPALGAAFEPCRFGGFALRTERGKALKCDGVHGPWSRHGAEPLAMALGVSCNVYFYQVALQLGPSGLDRALRRFGLLEDADPGLLRPASRSLPGLRLAATRKEPVTLEQRGIGYGIELSPVAMLRAYAALATGFLVQPRTVLAIEGEPRPEVERRPLGISATALERVRRGLVDCTAPWGTAGKDGLDRLHLAGKTGTPEFASREGTKNNAWFAGFGPVPEPRFSVVCVVYSVPDGTHGGEAAAPVAARFLRRVAAHPRLGPLLFGAERGR